MCLRCWGWRLAHGSASSGCLVQLGFRALSPKPQTRGSRVYLLVLDRENRNIIPLYPLHTIFPYMIDSLISRFGAQGLGLGVWMLGLPWPGSSPSG